MSFQDLVLKGKKFLAELTIRFEEPNDFLCGHGKAETIHTKQVEDGLSFLFPLLFFGKGKKKEKRRKPKGAPAIDSMRGANMFISLACTNLSTPCFIFLFRSVMLGVAFRNLKL